LRANKITRNSKGAGKMKMQELNFGIEIETVKITRQKAAEAIQSVVGGSVRHVGSPMCYDPWTVTDLRGRTWKVVSDASLTNVPGNLRAEVVSPVLKYDDIPQLQEVIRKLRAAGAKPTKQGGIHVHVDAAPFTAQKMSNLAKMVYKQEELLIHALGINSNRLNRYTRPTSENFIHELERRKPKTREELNRIWYGYYNSNPQHYDNTRYRILNLHSAFSGQTIEMRAFESTLHSGKIKGYVQLVLGLAVRALNAKSTSAKKREFNPRSAKYDFRVFLISSLKMNGPEFKTARYHLLKNMPGSAAWKNGRPVRQAAVNAMA
jgi:hypothetical protein